MNLDEAQKQKVSQWVEEGLKLSEIQGKLASELGVSMTYMEVRFLIDDIGAKLKDKEPPPPPPAPAAAPATSPAGTPPQPGAASEPESIGGKVSITVDQVTRPGALVSGKVTFSDGKGAEWYLDQMGRLGVVPTEKDYKPSQEDILEFQTELQTELARLGF